MSGTEPFERYADRYEEWFERHPRAYECELDAVRRFVGTGLKGLEVGVGTGRFAAPLGIEAGVEPSPRMAAAARARGVRVVDGVGEALPFGDGEFDFVLMVTTICFLDEPLAALREAGRVIRPGGFVVVGFVDLDSALGKRYAEKKEESVFYRPARFFTAAEVVALLEEAGFSGVEAVQTLFVERLEEVEERGCGGVKEGFGEGGFVVLRGWKKGSGFQPVSDGGV